MEEEMKEEIFVSSIKENNKRPYPPLDHSITNPQ